MLKSVEKKKSVAVQFAVKYKSETLISNKIYAPFLPLIPETRNLHRFLVSGNSKNGSMEFFSIITRAPHGTGLLLPTGLYTFTPGHAHQLTSSVKRIARLEN